MSSNRFSHSYFYSHTHCGSIKFWLQNKLMAEIFFFQMTNDIDVWATRTVRWAHRDNEIFVQAANRFGRFASTNETDESKEVRKKMVNAMQLRKHKCINSFVVHAQTLYAKLNTHTNEIHLHLSTCTCTSITFDFNLLYKIVKMNGKTFDDNNRKQICKFYKCKLNRSELPVVSSWNSVESEGDTDENKRQAKNIDDYFHLAIEKKSHSVRRLPYFFECKMSIRSGIIDGNDLSLNVVHMGARHTSREQLKGFREWFLNVASPFKAIRFAWIEELVFCSKTLWCFWHTTIRFTELHLNFDVDFLTIRIFSIHFYKMSVKYSHWAT